MNLSPNISSIPSIHFAIDFYPYLQKHCNLDSSFNQISNHQIEDQLKLERAGFTAEIGGFDTHIHLIARHKGFEKINKVIKTFKEEMEAQNAWNDVAVVLVSDFGRTITSNGKEPTMVSMILI